jgi:outer membrane protein insertion porin family
MSKLPKNFVIILFLFLLPFGFIYSSNDKFEIAKIQFIGADEFSGEELSELIYSEEDEEFDARLVKLDKIVLINFYRKNGFLTAEVNDSLIQDNKSKQVHINYVIYEGQRYYLGRFEFFGNKIINTDYLQSIFEEYKSGEPFDEGRINQGKQIIEGHYYIKGKPYINLKLDYQFEQDSLVVVIFEIIENQTVYLKDIKYVGLKLVKKFLIRRELEFEKNEVYNRKKLDDSQQNIYGTGLFEYVRFELEAIPNDTTNVILNILVKERDPRWIGFRVGYGYEQEESYGNKLDLTMEGGHRNLFGTARSISLHLVPSFQYSVKSKRIVNPENQVTFVFVEPWIGYTRTPGVFQVSYNQYRPLNSADFNVFRTSFNVNHKFNNKIETSGGIEVKFVDQLSSGSIDSTLESDAGKDQIYSLSLFANKDTRKNFFDPQNASVTEIGLSFSNSIDRDPENKSNNTQYITFVSSWKRYQPVKFKLFRKDFKIIFATRLKTGSIFELKSEGNIPISDLFFAGGASTVRGYDEQLLGPVGFASDGSLVARGGKFLFLANTELRFPIYWLFVGEIFLDGGQVWNEIDQIRANEIKFSTGAGIALITPIGPIRFDYGYKLFPESYEDNYNFHIGFYFAF